MLPLALATAAGPRRLLLTGAGGAVSRPLVVMLHGTGGSAEFAADETPWAELAEEAGFLVAFPDALPVDPTSPPSFLSNPKRWHDGSPGTTGPDDVQFLSDAMAHLIAHHHADPARVYLTGFSNGASMAFRFAAERPDLLAAVAPVAGYCHVNPAKVIPPVPTLYVIGDADSLLPLAGGPVRLPWGNRVVARPPVEESLRKWAAALGCDPEPTPVSGTEARYAGPVEFTRVIVPGLGHHWPGGKGQFNPHIAGPVVRSLDGCRRVWGFFARHHL